MAQAPFQRMLRGAFRGLRSGIHTRDRSWGKGADSNAGPAKLGSGAKYTVYRMVGPYYEAASATVCMEDGAIYT
jgi:hypothetical protein